MRRQDQLQAGFEPLLGRRGIECSTPTTIGTAPIAFDFMWIGNLSRCGVLATPDLRAVIVT
jgi:hypothetical protein